MYNRFTGVSAAIFNLQNRLRRFFSFVYPWCGAIVLLGAIGCGSDNVVAEIRANIEVASAGPGSLVTDYKLDESIFANPERGFYIYTNLHELDPTIGDRRDEGYALVRGRIHMQAYRDVRFLPESFLDAVADGFDVARDQGMKVIVRGSYGYLGPGGDYLSYADPPRNHVENHIEQLAPIFADNADVIALFEAGFIGPWGEWHTTEIAESYDLGRELLFHILDHTPTDRLVLVRYPYLKQRIFKESSGGYSVVDAGNAYSGERVSRVGHHNDCFLSSPNDVGTYERGEMTRTEEVAYLASETLYTAFGGETCRPHVFNDCGRTIAELEMLKASYLNSSYHPKVLAKWMKQGCFEEVRQRLGARLVLNQSRIAAIARPGGQLAVEIDLENQGFASLYNARHVEIALENEAGKVATVHVLDIDPRAWKPGKLHAIDVSLPLSADLVPGVYTAYLHLPDASPRLRDDPRYAYRIANLGVWDGERGYNKLASGIVIEGAGN